MIDLKNIRNIHCIGIGGIGLSAIADILLAKGYNVSGSDVKESDITKSLSKKGATVYYFHDGNNLNEADMVVYTAAVTMENPEMLKAKEMGLPMVTRAEMLGYLMKECENSIAIAGTHGKTTTTSMVSLILKDADLDPTLLIGGKLAELGGNVRIGHGPYFVTEACEYMDSFLSLKPKVEIILNIDSDHLDYFRDIDHIVESFTAFMDLVPEDGIILAYDGNPFVKAATGTRSNVITFGLSKSCDYAALDIIFDSEGLPTYSLYHKGEKLTSVKLNIPGEYNILNSLAAIACCHGLGVAADSASDTLSKYRGTERRFDIVGNLKKGVKIIDDYAHHPTEIKAMLEAANNISHKKLWCIFQPHTYTRTLALFDEFAGAFGLADNIVLAEIYPAREKNIQNISSKKLVPVIKENYPEKNVIYFSSFEEIADYVYKNSQKGDLVITTGAGDVNKIGTMLMERDF